MALPIFGYQFRIVTQGLRQGGLYVYDQSSRTLEKRGFYDSNVYAVAEGADGSLWLGTRGNGLSVDGKWYRNTSEDAFSLGSNSIFAMLRDKKDRMWVGTFGGGLNLAVPDEAGASTTTILSWMT